MATIDLTGDDSGCAAEGRRRRRGRDAAGGAGGAGEAVIVIEDEEADDTSGGGPAGKRPKSERREKRADAPPAWQGLNGARRLMAEFKEMQEEIAASQGAGAPCGPARLKNLEFHQDNMFCWRMELCAFDADLAEGRQLNSDLQALEAQERGAGAIKIEVKFPPDFPRTPFFLRVVRPRFVMYTGHITAGGAVCIQALTTGPSASNWQADYSVSGILALIATNMLDKERVPVRTATGPGGMSGPARVDMHMSRYEYSEHEATAAFSRMLQHHQVNGW